MVLNFTQTLSQLLRVGQFSSSWPATLLLCTDGLSETVKREELAEAFRTRSLSEAVSSLIALANDRGGDDNITLLAARVEDT